MGIGLSNAMAFRDSTTGTTQRAAELCNVKSCHCPQLEELKGQVVQSSAHERCNELVTMSSWTAELA